MKKYICESGAVKEKAEEYRSNYIKLVRSLHDIAATYGCSEIKYDRDMMLLTGIKFTTPVPETWTSPKWLGGFSRPKKTKENLEISKYFTPDGSYACHRHQELSKFHEWLAFPRSYSYTSKDGYMCTSSVLSGSIFGPALYWFSPDGPILLALPDIEDEKARRLAEGATLIGNELNWKPPEGLRETTTEEWKYLVAKHDFETQVNKDKNK